jgi:hypothetical protein
MDIKALVDLGNQLLLVSALVVLIVYVHKTTGIAKSSQRAAQKLKETSAASQQVAELSYKILEEMRRARSLLTAPVIKVFFKREKGRLFFVLQNVGAGLAKDVRYKFSPELRGEDGENIERIVKLGDGLIDTVPPGYQLKNEFGHVGYYIDNEFDTGEEYNLDMPREFDVKVEYTHAVTGEKISYTYKLDLRVSTGACLQ